MSEPEFRDIRPDIQARLTANGFRIGAVEREREQEILAVQARYKAQESELHQERQLLQSMLESENKRLGNGPTIVPEEEHISLGDFFIDVVKATGPKKKEQLQNLARTEGYFGEDSGGRQTNITLSNFVRGGRLLVDVDGNYCLPEQVAANARQEITRRL